MSNSTLESQFGEWLKQWASRNADFAANPTPEEIFEGGYNSANDSVVKALSIALECGSIDGAHHKAWVIDQMVRALTGDNYEHTIKEFCKGEDGDDTYAWDTGIAP